MPEQDGSSGEDASSQDASLPGAPDGSAGGTVATDAAVDARSIDQSVAVDAAMPDASADASMSCNGLTGCPTDACTDNCPPQFSVQIPGATYPAPTNATDPRIRRLEVADLNGDGKADVVALNRQGTVTVFLGGGDGTFLPSKAYSTGDVNQTTTGMVVADLNNDNKLDLAVSTIYGVPILLGNGDGSFQSALTPYAAIPQAVAAGDLNGDSKADLVLSANGGVTVWIGNGDGSFAAGDWYYTSGDAFGVAVGDVNHDGKLDVVVGGGGTGYVSVLFGAGDGKLGGPGKYYAEVGVQEIVIADFNHDQQLDVATQNAANNRMSILLGSAGGALSSPANVNVQSGVGQLTVGDLDLDGNLDLVEANAYQVGVFLGNGNGTFGGQHTLPIFNVAAVALGDFNGDGKLDIATGWDSLVIFLNTTH